jgi:hypothetical protein
MATNYPSSKQTLPNPTGTDLLENADPTLDHDYQHGTINDTVEALQDKVGMDGSAVTTSHDYKLSEVTSTDKAVGKTATQTLTNKTLTSPQINFGSDAAGDMSFRNGSGVTARLPIGTSGQILSASSGGIPEWIANPSASDASETVKGVVEEATQTEVIAGTTTGSTGARLFVNPSKISSLVSAYYGDGSDGDVVISSNTTLTRDMYYDDLTINSTFTLSTGGYRVFVKGTLTNNGTIANNGVVGANGTNATSSAIGTGGAGGAAPAGVTVFSTANAGTTGGNGGSQAVSPTVGANGTNITYSVGTIGGKGGNGGVGSTGGAGAVSGTVGTVTASGTNGIKDIFLAFTQNLFGNSLKAGTPGTGGGGGLADGASSGTHYAGGAGGGGSCGGVVLVAAKILAGTGVISSVGGNGGNAGTGHIGTATGNAGVGGSGGGGGGAGGILILVSSTNINPYTMTVTGGTGGTGGAAINIGSANAGAGSNGANGTAGVSIFLTT